MNLSEKTKERLAIFGAALVITGLGVFGESVQHRQAVDVVSDSVDETMGPVTCNIPEMTASVTTTAATTQVTTTATTEVVTVMPVTTPAPVLVTHVEQPMRELLVDDPLLPEVPAETADAPEVLTESQSSASSTTALMCEDTQVSDSSEFWYVSAGLITEEERIWLCNTVGHEYGSDWVPVPEKAKVVATVMNRLWYRDDCPNDMYSVLKPGQFSTCRQSTYCDSVTESCIEAVTYYFNHQDEFGSIWKFWGDGKNNYFS